MPLFNVATEMAGIYCKQKTLTNLPLDFPQTVFRAAGFGLLVTIPLFIVVLLNVETAWVAASLSWPLGLCSGLVGLLVGWLWDKARKPLFG